MKNGVLRFWILKDAYEQFKRYLTSEKIGFIEEFWWPGKFISQLPGVREVYLLKKLNGVWYLRIRINYEEELNGYLIEPIVSIS